MKVDDLVLQKIKTKISRKQQSIWHSHSLPNTPRRWQTKQCVTSYEMSNGMRKHVFENVRPGNTQSKKISNDQELIQSDPTSCPQNQIQLPKIY